MKDKVSLVKEKINDSIVRLFSYLPYGGFYTDSKFDEITRELTVIANILHVDLKVSLIQIVIYILYLVILSKDYMIG